MCLSRNFYEAKSNLARAGVTHSGTSQTMSGAIHFRCEPPAWEDLLM